MPETAVGGGKERSGGMRQCGGGLTKWIELAGRITSEQYRLGAKVLDGEAPWIKFNRDGIVTG
jgi:hypothetical protein